MHSVIETIALSPDFLNSFGLPMSSLWSISHKDHLTCPVKQTLWENDRVLDKVDYLLIFDFYMLLALFLTNHISLVSRQSDWITEYTCVML